jgi:hypothetical protein
MVFPTQLPKAGTVIYLVGYLMMFLVLDDRVIDECEKI